MIIVVNLLIGFLYSTKDLNIYDLIIQDKQGRQNDVYREDFNEGASEAVLVVENGEFVFRYNKSKERKNAFAAVYFPLEELELDFDSYATIQFELTTNKAKRIPINLSPDKKVITNYYLTQYLEVDSGKHTYKLKLSDFTPPASWFEENNITQTEVEKELLNKYSTISISSCHLLEKGIWDEIRISDILLVKDFKAEVIILGLIAFVCLIALWLLSKDYFTIQNEVIHVPIQHADIETKGSSAESIKELIAKDYIKPELKLKDIQFEIGLSQSEVSKLFKTEFKMSFPQYLNFVRVEAAKKLLKNHPELTISEIGYQVGFNSLNNFTRVFKSLEKVPPKIYRES